MALSNNMDSDMTTPQKYNLKTVRNMLFDCIYITKGMGFRVVS